MVRREARRLTVLVGSLIGRRMRISKIEWLVIARGRPVFSLGPAVDPLFAPSHTPLRSAVRRQGDAMSMTTTVRRLLGRRRALRRVARDRPRVPRSIPPTLSSRARSLGTAAGCRRARVPSRLELHSLGAFRHFRTLAPTRAGARPRGRRQRRRPRPRPGRRASVPLRSRQQTRQGGPRVETSQEESRLHQGPAKTHRENRAARAKASGRSGGWSGGERLAALSGVERRKGNWREAVHAASPIRTVR